MMPAEIRIAQIEVEDIKFKFLNLKSSLTRIVQYMEVEIHKGLDVLAF